MNQSSTQELLNMAVAELEKERALRIKAEKTIAEQKSKVLFADVVTASDKSILVGEMANILKQSGIETGQERFFAWLRDHEYLYRIPCGENRPTQKSLELGVMEIAEQAVVLANGRSKIRRTVKITPAGQIYFMDVLTRYKEEINEKEAARKKANNKRASEVRRKKRLEENLRINAEQQGA